MWALSVTKQAHFRSYTVAAMVLPQYAVFTAHLFSTTPFVLYICYPLFRWVVPTMLMLVDVFDRFTGCCMYFAMFFPLDFVFDKGLIVVHVSVVMHLP